MMTTRMIVLMLAAALTACVTPEVDDDGDDDGPGPRELISDNEPCLDCSCPQDESCDPALGGADCPGSGCCDQVPGPDGEPIYRCVQPTCFDDGDCFNGQICLTGASCGASVCGCETDPDPYHDDDRDLHCCPVNDVNGICCVSGELDPDGTCACDDPLMTDAGWGCLCPGGMYEDTDGLCHCDDPSASYDPAVGECACPPEMIEESDPYLGMMWCRDPEEPPDDCGDPYAEIDPETGGCECIEGFVLGDTAGGMSPLCVPIGCGDDVCSGEETCETCDYDCSCDDPDAGVDAGTDAGIDAGVPDAYVPDAYVPDAGVPDAGIPDAGIPDAYVPDAMVIPDAMVVPDAGPIPDAGSIPDAGTTPCGGRRLGPKVVPCVSLDVATF